MGFDQYLYIITTDQLRKLREVMLKDTVPYSNYFKWMDITLPSPIWQWRKDSDVSDTVFSFQYTVEAPDLYSFQHGISFDDLHFQSLEDTNTHYLYYESW